MGATLGPELCRSRFRISEWRCAGVQGRVGYLERVSSKNGILTSGDVQIKFQTLVILERGPRKGLEVGRCTEFQFLLG